MAQRQLVPKSFISGIEGPKLTPRLDLRPVILDRPRFRYRLQRPLYSFLVTVLSFPLLQTPAFGMDQAVTRLKAKCAAALQEEQSGQSALIPGMPCTNPDFFLAGHTDVPGQNVPGQNSPHTNVPHHDSPSRHSNTSGGDMHVNLQQPHSNSPHANYPHTNTSHQNTPHSNVTTPSTGSEGA